MLNVRSPLLSISGPPTSIDIKKSVYGDGCGVFGHGSIINPSSMKERISQRSRIRDASNGGRYILEITTDVDESLDGLSRLELLGSVSG